MKSKISIFIGLLLLLCGLITQKSVASDGMDLKKGPVTLMCSDDLLPLSEKLVGEFLKANPDFGLTVKSLGSAESSGLLQKEMYSELILQGSPDETNTNPGWRLVVGREIIVPVINSENPYFETLKEHGLSSGKLAKVISGDANWGSILGNGQNIPVDFFLADNYAAQAAVSNFVGINQAGTLQPQPTDNFISAIQKDIYAIGFCRLTDILDSGHRELISGIKLLPIDKNANGLLDYHEQIYGSLDNLMRGIWIGKYPRQLVHNIYLATSRQPENQNIAEFMSWVLTEGQQFMEPYGFSELVASERLTKLEKITRQEILVESPEESNAALKTFLFVIGILVAGGIALGFAARLRKDRLIPLQDGLSGQNKVLNENAIIIPDGLYFDKTHTWIYLEKDGVAKIGIDDFIQHITGKFTRISMKEPGKKVKKDEPILTLIQKGKQITINAPISGTIKEINELLVTDPATLNQSPYGEGWVYMIEPSNWLREIQFFKMTNTYKEWIRTEFIRLKDFLAVFLSTGGTAPSAIALQEGGELKGHVLQDLGPELWEEFQRGFIDTSGM